MANEATRRVHHVEDELHGRAKTLALAGLFIAIFVSMLAMNVVGTSMPVIIADLKGTQSSFTWVIVTMMLASAISTPIWGKLADLTNKKILLQTSLVLFVLGCALAGLSPNAEFLIAVRALQGIGAGGLGALVQIVLAEIVSPRERGKYSGIMGALMGISTVGGPLLGGMITDTIGWRWNFYVAVPIAVVALIFLQMTLHLTTEKRKVKIDYLGAVLISVGFSSLLLWVTLGGNQIEWASWESAAFVVLGVLCLIAAVIVELKVEEPIIPMSLFKNRTFTVSVIASLAIGIAMFATMIYLGQYLQLARGKTPTEAGLLTLPMVAGMLVASTIGGNLITRFGKWKALMVSGAIMTLIGLGMMALTRHDTSFFYLGVAMFILGAGTGLTMQNLVLVTQNSVQPGEIGVASSGVTFFRTLAGTAGTSVMGAVLASQVGGYIQDELAKVSPAALNPANFTPSELEAVKGLQSGHLPSMSALPDAVRTAVELAYGHAIGNVFLAVTPVALIGVIAIAMLPNRPLSALSAAQQRKENAESAVFANTGAIDIVSPDAQAEDAERTASSRSHSATSAEKGESRESREQ